LSHKISEKKGELFMELNVGTFNIQHGKDHLHFLQTGEEVIDLKKMADVIRSANLDVCGLNEVRNDGAVGGAYQAKVIAEALGYHFAFAKAIDHRGGEYGNALVSRYPIEQVCLVPIAVEQADRIAGQHFENRVLLCATLLVDRNLLTVLVSHFGLNDDE
jgi:endonuclease/exonuclease/phosphatase family metal-dependent hydrolase